MYVCAASELNADHVGHEVLVRRIRGILKGSVPMPGRDDARLLVIGGIKVFALDAEPVTVLDAPMP